MISVALGSVVVLLAVVAVTARWSSVRARRRLVAYLNRVAALPAIAGARRGGARTSPVRPAADADLPPAEARLYFLDVYRDAARRRGAMRPGAVARAARPVVGGRAPARGA